MTVHTHHTFMWHDSDGRYNLQLIMAGRLEPMHRLSIMLSCRRRAAGEHAHSDSDQCKHFRKR